MFGYTLGDVTSRFARFEEALEVMTRLLRSHESASFDGQFFCLREAMLPPPRPAEGPPITIGDSGPKRTLPLVARFADIWNAQVVDVEQYRE
jgi:alkanesulfonate monooxygenase SsuD/methylene tetrahydromethanopterin reductase-like flavin-dependent oxidoreductase (luciferase family)